MSKLIKTLTAEYNVDIVGNLTNNNGVLSGFSSSNYATIPNAIALGNNFELVIKTNFGTALDDDALSSAGAKYIGIGCFGSDTLNLRIGNGTGWLKQEIIANSISPNTDYWFKIVANGNSYEIYKSTDGVDYGTRIFYLNSSYAMPAYFLQFGANYNRTESYLTGNVDLNECYIKVNNQLVWQGVSYKNNCKLIKIESAAEYIDLSSINIKNGAQFDTGLTGNADYRMVLDFIPRSYSGGCILGQDSSDGDNNDFRFFNFQGQIFYDIGSARLQGSSCTIDTRYKFEFGNYYVKNYGSSSNILSGSTQTFTSNYPVVVQGGSDGITFYSLDIYLGNDKVREYVPKKRISDGEIGIYDNINGTFVTRTDGYGTAEAGLNIIPVGSPTITDNLITGFSSNSYAIPTVKFPSNTKKLDMQIKFKTPSSFPRYYGAFGGEAFALYLTDGKVRVLMSSDNGQWDIAGRQTTVDCSANAWHTVRLTYNGSVYKYFLDGALIYSTSNNLTLKGNSDIAIGGWLYNGTTSCLDTASGTVVDLQNTYIKVNGDYYWWAYPSAPKTHYKLIMPAS